MTAMLPEIDKIATAGDGPYSHVIGYTTRADAESGNNDPRYFLAVRDAPDPTAAAQKHLSHLWRGAAGPVEPAHQQVAPDSVVVMPLSADQSAAIQSTRDKARA